jgi:4-amino-4-deoxy-L-arabinose transferase-like glycosyltransferase
MADSVAVPGDGGFPRGIAGENTFLRFWVVLAFGVAIFLGCIFSPPSLMDDVDAVNAQIAREMLSSGDWVTARINGVVYLEKSPLGYWLMASSYAIFGVHDWAARLPTALGAIGLMWATALLGHWGFGQRAGIYAGLAVGTSVGLFLFTRTVIPDVLLTLAITCSLYCFLRAIVDEQPRWAWGFWAFLGIGLLLKGLLAALVPVAAGTIFLLFRRRFFTRRSWHLMRPLSGIMLTLGIYLPWVALATWRNPPFFDFTLRSTPGVYRGFFWFYFINEHLLRFLNLRYPRDYNTVPRMTFWLLHLAWIFPWTVFLPAAFGKESVASSQTEVEPGPHQERADSLQLLAIVWILFLLVFLSFSTTQEYYSMPCYPAFAVLVGRALTRGRRSWIMAGYGILAGLGILCTSLAGMVLFLVRDVTPAGDISSVLTQNPEAYTLSLGHLQDLTLNSFGFLKGPLFLAGLALGAGGIAAWRFRRRWFAPLCLAAMMTLLIHASNWAMKVFDPYLSSRPLADAINAGPEGQLVLEGHYYPFSSVGFYTNRHALLLNGVADNLIYGAAAPSVPPVFINDEKLARLWPQEQRVYLVIPESSRPRLEALLHPAHVFAESGGKLVLTNTP